MASIAPPSHPRRDQTTDSWITPRSLIEKLGPFDLDPCACDPQPWPTASRMVTEKENGLLLTWSGFVWCNPPYGRALGIWLERMALHQNGIALVFARTDTRAFHQHVWPHADAMLVIRGRLTFCRPDGTPAPNGHNSGGPSVLIGYGPRAVDRLAKVSSLGAFVSLRS